jgi:hypothetical protein
MIGREPNELQATLPDGAGDKDVSLRYNTQGPLSLKGN